MNTEALQSTEQTPDLELMPRVDTPAIWDGYRDQVAKLKLTAETLTVTDVSQVAEMKLARVTRLALREVRVIIEKCRKELGEDALRRKQRIDEAAKELKDLIEPLEERLLEQEQFAIRAEEKRLADRLADRCAKVSNLGASTAAYRLDTMPDADFDTLLSDLAAAKQAREEAAAKAEADRIAKAKAEAEDRERLRIDNIRLQKEAAEREEAARKQREAHEAEIAKERQRAEAEQKAAQVKAENERRRIQAEHAAEAERLRKERETAAAKAKAEHDALEAKANDERRAREKAESDLKSKQAKEAAEKKAAAQAEAKAARAPDKQKLTAFADSLALMKLPTMATEDGKAALEKVRQELELMTNRVRMAAANL